MLQKFWNRSFAPHSDFVRVPEILEPLFWVIRLTLQLIWGRSRNSGTKNRCFASHSNFITLNQKLLLLILLDLLQLVDMSQPKRPSSKLKPSSSSLLALFSKPSLGTENVGRKRKRPLAEAHDKSDSFSLSSSSTLSGEERNSTLATDYKIQSTKENLDLDNSHKDDLTENDSSSVTSQMSAESYFHEDDESQRRNFDNSILLYSTDVMRRLAMETSQEVAEPSEAQGEQMHSRQIVLAFDRHTKAIIDSVRRRLRESNLPNIYATIAEGDTCKEGMERINKERALTVEKTALLSSKLEEQKGQIEKRLDTETRKRDKLKEEEEKIKKLSRKKVHPFLSSYMERLETEADDTGKKNKQLKPTNLDYIPAPPRTLTKLLDKVSSKQI
jgi:hypothetical protein